MTRVARRSEVKTCQTFSAVASTDQASEKNRPAEGGGFLQRKMRAGCWAIFLKQKQI